MTHLKKKLPPMERNKITASMAVAKDAADHVQLDYWNADPTLPVWRHTTTTAKAETVFENGAAILPNGVVGDAELPRVEGFRKILIEIDKAVGRSASDSREGYYVADLLRDIDFQHHQSTNGLWNSELGRWERWGARDLDGWLYPQGKKPKSKWILYRRVNERTFRRIKKNLIAQGLIQEVRKDFPRGRRIWLKPTPELSRILFEPGYWETVRSKYVPPKKQPSKSGKKPRGLSARSKQIDEENLILYRQVIHYELTDLTAEMKKLIWDKLTKPIPLTKKYVKKPFTEFGSYRYKRLSDAL